MRATLCSSRRGWVAIQLLLSLSVPALVAWQLLARQPIWPAEPPFGQRVLVERSLHGSTPSLAWSPDGRRLAVNAAYGYYGHEAALARHRAGLGVWILDAARGRVERVASQQGYHPFWLDGSTVGFACSGYEDCPEGLFLVPAEGGAPRALGDLKTVHRALLARDGRILVYQGYQGGEAWYLVDARSGERQPALGERVDSWSRPSLAVDQCPQKVGRVEVRWERDRLVLGTAFGEHSLEAEPFVFRGSGGTGAGPVPPCLSPDGRLVAFLSPAPDGYRVRVVEVTAGRGASVRAVPPEDPPGMPEPARAELDVLESLARLGLHGSTPSLAWSPDGRRVVANAAYEYFGHEGEVDALTGRLGVWLLEAGRGATHVFAGQAYHPFWLSAHEVGWGVSEYEQGSKGIWLAPARASARPRRVGKLQGVHRTLLARDGRILAYVGFPEYLRWIKVDPKSGRHVGVLELEGRSSWDDPAGQYVDQCLARAGAAALVDDPEHGFLVQVGGRRYRLGDRPLFRYSYESGSGPVRPCLSRDGLQVAFFLQGAPGEGTLELRIARVPAS
jgi:hypothetical protein